MNIGRLLVGFSAALAVVAAGGFAVTVFGTPDVRVDGGGEMCFASQVGTDGLAGIGLSNESGSSIVLDAASVGSTDGLTAGDTWVQTGTTLTDGNGLGSVYYTDVDKYELRALAGTVVAPGEDVRIVYRLISTDGGGLATDFRVDYTGEYGMHHSATSPMVVGFSSTDPEGEYEGCGE